MFSHLSNSWFENVIPAVCRRESLGPAAPGFLTTAFRNDATQLLMNRRLRTTVKVVPTKDTGQQ
jgi:hypothetical protein